MSTAPATVTVEAAFERLARGLWSNPPALARLAGDVAFVVVGQTPQRWQLVVAGGMPLVKPGSPPFPVLTVGLTPRVLCRLVDGTLDVARSFRDRRLAVEGDLGALAALAACFHPLTAEVSP